MGMLTVGETTREPAYAPVASSLGPRLARNLERLSQAADKGPSASLARSLLPATYNHVRLSRRSFAALHLGLCRRPAGVAASFSRAGQIGREAPPALRRPAQSASILPPAGRSACSLCG